MLQWTEMETTPCVKWSLTRGTHILDWKQVKKNCLKVHFLLEKAYALRICVVPCCHWSFFVYPGWRSVNSEQRQRPHHAWSGRLKTLENYKTIRPKSGRGRLWEVSVFVYERFNYRAFTGKVLVCLIAGRLWDVVAHGISKAWKFMVNVSEKALPATT